MNINSDGAEIDAARDMEVYGDWIKFVDGDRATVKIAPSVIRELYEFAIEHAGEFDEGEWNIDWQPVFAMHQISEKVEAAREYLRKPAQRQWQGLTDDDIREIIINLKDSIDLYKAIETKLKEKNT